MKPSGLGKILNGSVLVGRPFGIPIYLHVTILFFLWPFLSLKWLGFFVELEFVLLIVLSILAHELGHALTAKHFKRSGLSITLHGFGGFASSSGWGNPNQELLIVLAGPAVTFAIGILCVGIGYLGLESHSASALMVQQFQILHSLGRLEILMGFLNLVPTLPWDGGLAVQAILWRKLPLVKATRAVSHLGMLITPPILIYAVIVNDGYLGLFALVGLITSFMTLRQTGGIRFGEVFADRKDRKLEEAARQRAKEANDRYVSDVHDRQREREEKERLRKLFEKSGIDE